ncbi:hypothetical protein ACXJY6_06840 [Vibrio sp. RC27]
MNLKKYALQSLILGITFLPQIAFAIDGYKSLKFGMSKQQVIASDICTLQKLESGQVGVEYYGCSNFNFGGKSVEAGVFFINNELLRVGIVPSVDIVEGVVASLSDKYGPPSSISTEEEFEAVDTLPNRQAFLGFDRDTIYLILESDENYTQSALLVYTSPKYDVLLLENQKNAINEDL